MMPLVIEGANATLSGGDDSGVGRLRLYVVEDEGVKHFVSRWEPMPHELELLIRGGSVELWCMGAQPPVALVVVGHAEPLPELEITDIEDDDDERDED